MRPSFIVIQQIMSVTRWIVLPLLPKALYELGFFEGIVRSGNPPDNSDDLLTETILHGYNGFASSNSTKISVGCEYIFNAGCSFFKCMVLLKNQFKNRVKYI